MKELKRVEGKVIRMYSFGTEKEAIGKIWEDFDKEYTTNLFAGTKEELKLKPEEFWRGIIDKIIYETEVSARHSPLRVTFYKNYITEAFGSLSAKESGHSAIEDEDNFIIITQETI